MKIIAKSKDYYDHEIGYFGYDETRVYDRRSTDRCPFYEFSKRFLLAICGQFIPIIKQNGKFIFNAEECNDWRDRNFISDYKDHKTKANEFFRQPVVALDDDWDDSWLKHQKQNEYFIPILKELGVPKIFDSRTMYSMIYDYIGWLKDNPEKPNNQSNKEKVISHGFDTTHSFRPKMRKV